jgi:Glycosyl hydrolases family 16
MAIAQQLKVFKGAALAVIIMVAVGCKKSSVPATVAPPQWQLDFQDDFSGTAVDTTVWGMYDSPGNGGNGLRRPEAFSVQNGSLVVTATMKNGMLVSGGMAHRRNYLYGKFEFRVRAEPDSSHGTDAVVLTWPQSENWPTDGENDIFETFSASRDPFSTNIHYSSTNQQYSYQQNADGTQWHVMSMEWSPDKLVILRDSVLVYTLLYKAAIAKVPHHLCIQLDAIKPIMTGTTHMYVDWVKIYRLKE